MPSISSAFQTQFKQAAQDRRIEKPEKKQLQQALGQESLAPQDKMHLSKALDHMSKSTATPHFALFNDGEMSAQEFGKVHKTLGKVADQSAAESFRKSALDLIADPQEKTKAQAYGSFSPTNTPPGKAPQNAWHTTQFSDYEAKYGQGSYSKDYPNRHSITGSKRSLLTQASSSCGPTCTLMMLKAHGLGQEIQGIGHMRKVMSKIDGRVSSQSGGIDPEPIAKTLNTLSKGKLQAEVHREKKEGFQNADDMLKRMKTTLDKGESIILLTQYMDNDPNRMSDTGHYVVLTGIDQDKNLIFADPYSPSSASTVSFAEFESVFKHRQNHTGSTAYKYPNAFISVAPQ